jgi:hypothetical protein
MAADVALDPKLRASLYPFCRLSGPANVLIMPGIHAAHILTRAVPQLTSSTVIGPLLTGLSHSAQISMQRASIKLWMWPASRPMPPCRADRGTCAFLDLWQIPAAFRVVRSPLSVPDSGVTGPSRISGQPCAGLSCRDGQHESHH